MLDPRPNVLRRSEAMTRNLYRQLVSQTVQRIQMRYGLTDEALADHIGACEGTIANARNQNNSLSGELLCNLLMVDDAALEGHLHHYGKRSVPIEAVCNTDELVSVSGLVHKLALARSELSEDRTAVTDNECLGMEDDLREVDRAVSALLARCHHIRKARAA